MNRTVDASNRRGIGIGALKHVHRAPIRQRHGSLTRQRLTTAPQSRQAIGHIGLSDYADLCSAPAEAPSKSDVESGIGYGWPRGADIKAGGRASESWSVDTTPTVAETGDVRAESSVLVKTLTLILSVMTVCLAIRYIAWRCEINDWRVWWLSLPLLIAEIFTAFHILGYQYTIWPRKVLDLHITEDVSPMPIYMFIPTVNEGAEILDATVLGAIAARARYVAVFPNAMVNIIICNDGFVAKVDDWRTPIALAAKHGVDCITRQIGGGAKAGNIEHAREQVGATGDSLIVVLDADQVAEQEFLLRTTPQFGDPTIGWVQTRQYYRNQESRVSRWAEHQASLFYDQVCPGKATLNASYICGTNVVVRARVLDEIGGFPQESITEDFAASIRTHQSWRSVYIKDVLAKGLGPMELTSYYAQQSRWAQRYDGRSVFRLEASAASQPQRDGLRPASSVFVVGNSLPVRFTRDAVFIGCAVTCLLLTRSPIKPVTHDVNAFYLLQYIVASQMLDFAAGSVDLDFLGHRNPVTGVFPTLTLSLFEALTNRRVHFKVTPKSTTQGTDLPVVDPTSRNRRNLYHRSRPCRPQPHRLDYHQLHPAFLGPLRPRHAGTYVHASLQTCPHITIVTRREELTRESRA